MGFWGFLNGFKELMDAKLGVLGDLRKWVLSEGWGLMRGRGLDGFRNQFSPIQPRFMEAIFQGEIMVLKNGKI